MKDQKPKTPISAAASQMAKTRHAKRTPEERKETSANIGRISAERRKAHASISALLLSIWDRHTKKEWEKLLSREIVEQVIFLLESGWKPKA